MLPARGNYVDLAANVVDLLDGEICYAIDQDQYYQKEGTILVSVGATKAQGLLADTAVQPGDLSIVASTGDYNDLLNKPSFAGGGAELTFQITASGTSSYLFAGPGFTAPTPNPLVTLVRGQTYRFNNTTGAHPLQIQSIAGQGGTAYNDGVTGNNTIGEVVFVVPFDAPSTLYYQCTAHSNMGGSLEIITQIGGGGGATTLDQLTDVDTSSSAPTDGQALVWSDSDSEWVPGTVTSVGNLNDLGDVETSGINTPADGQSLAWSDSANAWIPQDGAAVGSMSDLTDVSFGAVPQQDQLLGYSGGVWTNVTLPASGIEEAPSDGNQYVRQNAAWEQLVGGGGGASELGQLTDVDTTGEFPGAVLTFDGSSNAWIAQAPAGGGGDLGSLSDVDLSGMLSGDFLKYDGEIASWVPAPPTVDEAPEDGQEYIRKDGAWAVATGGGGGGSVALNDLTDVNVTGALSGDALKYDAEVGEWVAMPGGGLLEDLEDVNTTGAVTGDVLKWDSEVATWATAPDVTELAGLDDVDVSTTAPTDGQALIWNNSGGVWEPGTVSSGGGGSGATTLDELSDVDAATPGDGEALIYDGTSGSWKSTKLRETTTYGPFTPTNFHTFEGTGAGAWASSDCTDWNGPQTTHNAVFGTYAADGRPTNGGTQFTGQYTSSAILTGGAFTFSFYYSHDNVTNGFTNYIISSYENGSLNRYGGAIVIKRASSSSSSAGLAEKEVWLYKDDSSSNAICGTKGIVFDDDVMRHVVFTHDGNGLYRCFVDGVLIDTKEEVTPIDFNSTGDYSDLDFAVMGDGQGGGFARNYGVLDEFAIYDVDIYAGVSTFPAPTQSVSQPYSFEIQAPLGTLSDLGDVSSLIPLDGEVLVFNSTEGVYEPQALTIDANTDVDMATAAPENNNVLTYDGKAATWVPQVKGAGQIDRFSEVAGVWHNFNGYGDNDLYEEGFQQHFTQGLDTSDPKVGTGCINYTSAAGPAVWADFYSSDNALWIEFWAKHDGTVTGEQLLVGYAASTQSSLQGRGGIYVRFDEDTAYQLPGPGPISNSRHCIAVGPSNSLSDAWVWSRRHEPLDGQWHHYAIAIEPAYDGDFSNGGDGYDYFENDGTVSLYIDGILESRNETGSEINYRTQSGVSANQLVFMADTDGNFCFRGSMDNLRVKQGLQFPLKPGSKYFVPNVEDAGANYSYATTARYDSTLNLTDFSEIPAASGEIPMMQSDGQYTPVKGMEILAIYRTLNAEDVWLPTDSAAEHGDWFGVEMRAGQVIFNLEAGVMYMYTGPWEFNLDEGFEVGGWQEIPMQLPGGGGGPA